MNPPTGIVVERLFGGNPILPSTNHYWESGSIFNSAAVLLELTPETRPLIQALIGPDQDPRTIVVLNYRARPNEDPGYPWARSSVGVSIHEPNLSLIRRFEAPALAPGEPSSLDSQGVEDPRVSHVEGAWWMVYCGVKTIKGDGSDGDWLGSLCLAKSTDLQFWTKLGPIVGDSDGFAKPGELAKVSNKDGVLFPDRIGGKIILLHRPMQGPIPTWGTAIATADQVEGPYHDHGSIHTAVQSEKYLCSWVGAGSTPIKVGENKYLSIEHTGNFLDKSLKRKYVLDAFLYDFTNWDPKNPETLIAGRLDGFMEPETDQEIFGPFKESVSNVVFACGAYVYEEWLTIVYGGGDSYLLGARVKLSTLLEAMEAKPIELTH